MSGGTRAVSDRQGVVRGHVYLLYNARTGENCVVTIKSHFVGQSTRTAAYLYRMAADGSRVHEFRDDRSYKYYAGPVKAYARDTCVLFQGWIGEKSSAAHAYGGSPDFGNCGTKRRRKG